MSSGFVAACKGLQVQCRTEGVMLSNQIMQLKGSCRCRKAIQLLPGTQLSTRVNGPARRQCSNRNGGESGTQQAQMDSCSAWHQPVSALV